MAHFTAKCLAMVDEDRADACLRKQLRGKEDGENSLAVRGTSHAVEWMREILDRPGYIVPSSADKDSPLHSEQMRFALCRFTPDELNNMINHIAILQADEEVEKWEDLFTCLSELRSVTVKRHTEIIHEMLRERCASVYSKHFAMGLRGETSICDDVPTEGESDHYISFTAKLRFEMLRAQVEGYSDGRRAYYMQSCS